MLKKIAKIRFTVSSGEITPSPVLGQNQINFILFKNKLNEKIVEFENFITIELLIIKYNDKSFDLHIKNPSIQELIEYYITLNGSELISLNQIQDVISIIKLYNLMLNRVFDQKTFLKSFLIKLRSKKIEIIR